MTAREGTSEPGSRDMRDAVLARLQPRWGATRTEDNLAVAFRRIERARRLGRVGAAGALGLGALALVVTAWGWTARRTASPPPSLASRAPEAASPTSSAGPRRLELPDGSSVALADAHARAIVSRTSRDRRDRIDVTLSDGPAAFEVPARAGRTVVVTVARFEVAILAARFVLRPADERLEVTVSEGDVAVSWSGGHARVKAGETVALPAALEQPPEALRARAGTPEQRSRFRAQVARRDYAGAYRSLVAAPGVVDHSAEDLMLAADAARLSGHPATAVPYLRRLLRDHPTDVRGPVAAFTLGRVLLSELARPAEAADAFAASYRLAPTGPLAADALGREVEAAARAGDAARAHRLATTFVARYPDQPRAAAVRRAGGLD